MKKILSNLTILMGLSLMVQSVSAQSYSEHITHIKWGRNDTDKIDIVHINIPQGNDGKSLTIPSPATVQSDPSSVKYSTLVLMHGKADSAGVWDKAPEFFKHKKFITVFPDSGITWNEVQAWKVILQLREKYPIDTLDVIIK